MIRRTSLMSIVMLVMSVVMSAAVFASPVHIATITDKVDRPGRVAVGVDGTIYVAQPTADALNIYSSQGALIKAVTVKGVMSVAVDNSNGRIYIGTESAKKGSVAVYDLNMQALGVLGVGAGEFARPNSIAVSSTGDVFIVDSLRDEVKVFSVAGSRVASIGGTGNTDGLFNLPLAVALCESTGEVYVSDRQSINGVSGARISVFDMMNGYAFKRSYGQYGVSVQQMSAPVDIAIDAAGATLYVANGQNILKLDPQTGYINGAVDLPYLLAFPQGISLTKNGILYISNTNSNIIEEYGLDGYVSMSLSVVSLQYSASQYAANPAAQNVTISNSGTGAMSWIATSNQSWLTLSASSGSVSAASSQQLSVAVNTQNITPGIYNGAITIVNSAGQSAVMTVSLTLSGLSAINLSNGWLSFAATAGSTSTQSSNVSLSVQNGDSLAWSSSSDSAWLSVSPSSGMGTAVEVITVNPSGMKAGKYPGFITIKAPNATVSTMQIRVDLVIAASSKLTVKTNVASAAFSIAGPNGVNYSGTGQEWSVDGPAAGDYTVTYSVVPGYQRPLPQIKNVADNGSAVFEAIYKSNADLAVRRNIVVSRGEGAKNSAEIKAFKVDGAATSLDFYALTTMSGANVAVGDINGDGSDEIIVGAGSGYSNAALVSIWSSDKKELLSFTPFTSMYGVNVAVADIDGDGKSEIIVAPAGGASNVGTVRVYQYDGVANAMVPTGINFIAHSYKYGAKIAAGDVNGDQKPMIITAPGYGSTAPAEFSTWKVDTSKGIGNWTAALVNTVSLTGTYGANISTGDVDGDGKDEILSSPGYKKNAKQTDVLIRIHKADGTEMQGVGVFGKSTYGATVAAADLDGDGVAEVVAGMGKNHGSDMGISIDGLVKIYAANGTVKNVFAPFTDNPKAINVSVGSLGL